MPVRAIILAAVGWCVLSVSSAGAEARFHGVAAGDMTESEVILWTRADDGGKPAKVVAQVATDPGFTALVASANGATEPTNNFTLKLLVGGLASGQTYFYRFLDAADAADTSATGRFSTAPGAQLAVQVRFGFSGDTDGQWRPFPSIATIADQRLNFFVFLGDTIYETGSAGSPPAPPLTQIDGAAQAQQALEGYNRKYNENIQGVAADGNPSAASQLGLAPLFLATGMYVVMDNHELGNQSLQAGGAPPGLVAVRTLPDTVQFDVNTSGAFNNRTVPFMALTKAFFNNLPTRVDIGGSPAAANMAVTGPVVQAPEDARSEGTPRRYFAQRWGAHSIYIQTDTRLYRDARLGLDARSDDTGPRADNPARTMLGRTQLAWLKQTLLDAQASGATWKFVGLSSPIDQVGAQQDGKSWYGGYRAERNEVLKFIAENGIDHVVFISTDDHYTRVTGLLYRMDATDPATTRLMPDTIMLVTGPIGAGGPDRMKDRHNITDIQRELKQQNDSIVAAGGVPIGLQGTQGLTDVFRDGDPDAAAHPTSVDFYSPDTFAYMVVEVATDGTLTVQTWGIDSYARNAFLQGQTARKIMSFTLRP